MTGFGKGRVNFKGGYVVAELKSFNHKFFELSYKSPENLQPIEEQIKKTIKKSIKRGKVYLWITISQNNGRDPDIVIDEQKIRYYYKLLSGIRKKFNAKLDRNMITAA